MLKEKKQRNLLYENLLESQQALENITNGQLREFQLTLENITTRLNNLEKTMENHISAEIG